MMKSLGITEDPMENKGKDIAKAIFEEKPEDRIKIMTSIKDTLKTLNEIHQEKLLKI